MGITTTQLGPNSVGFACDQFTGADLLQLIQQTLVSAGYEIFDNISTVSKVFRNKCADGVTYKYIQIGASGTNLTLQVWEGWNNSTHVGTNQASISTASLTYITMPFKTASSDIVMFYSGRYIFFIVNGFTIAVTYGGVFEFSRDNPSDTVAAGFPSYFITTNVTLRYGTTTSGNLSTVGGTPRDRNGNLGVAAAAGSALLSTIGMIGGEYPPGASTYQAAAVLPANNVGGYCIAATPVYYSHLVSQNSALGGGYYSMNDYRGRVFGVKILPTGYALRGDVVSIKCDANGFADPSGMAVDHYAIDNFALPL